MARHGERPAVIEVQGTAAGLPFDRDALNQLLELADTGIRALIALQGELVGGVLSDSGLKTEG